MTDDLASRFPDLPTEHSQEALNDAALEAVDDFLVAIDLYGEGMPNELYREFETLCYAFAAARGINIPER